MRIYVTDPDAHVGNVGFFTRESAQVWDGDTRWDGSNNIDINVGANRSQKLYRTAQGRWVLGTWSQWANEDDLYVYTDDTGARDWLLFNDHDDAAEKYFGDIEEERGPGRPEVGSAVHVRLGDLVAQVDAWAKEHGVKSRADAIRQLVTTGLQHVGSEA